MGSGRINLTGDQQRAFDIIMRGDDTFVTGGAGTGKSVLIKEVIREFEKQAKNIVICAPTGIAAVNVGGVTIHKAFGFRKGPCITEKTNRLTVHTPKIVRMADVIVIDEVSMCRMDMMDAVCASVLKAREETGRHIQLVVVGDFCQLPPVIEEGSGERELMQDYYRKCVGAAYAFMAPGWKKIGFVSVTLHEVVRQQDTAFVNALNAIRMGDVSALKYINAHASFDGKSKAVRLYAFNNDVDDANEQALEMLPGTMYTFSPIYYGDMFAAPDKMTPLYLKNGALVIVTTNQAEAVSRMPYTLHNGSIGVVIDICSSNGEDDYVAVALADGSKYLVYRQMQDIYTLRLDNRGHIRRELTCQISYMPLKPAYAMTVHRSQGQTFDAVELDPSCRTSGQTYVGLSRVRTIEGLHLTRRITARDVYLDPVVKEFYDHLNDEDYLPSWERETQKVPEILQDNILPFPVDISETLQQMNYPVPEEPQPEFARDPSQEIPIYATSPEDFAETTTDAAVYAETVPTTPTPPKKKNESRYNAAAEEISNVFVTETDAIAPKATDTGDGQAEMKKNRGRPARYTNGAKVCRIPVELADEVQLMLQIVCPKGGMNVKKMARFKAALRELCETDQ